MHALALRRPGPRSRSRVRGYGAKNPQIPRRGRAVSGRRYYNPSQGRFLGRDPKMEKGGLNLYGFVTNNPINHWDYLGMEPDHTPTNAGETATVLEEIDPDPVTGMARYRYVTYRAVRLADMNNQENGSADNDLIWVVDESGNRDSTTRGMPENGNNTPSSASASGFLIFAAASAPRPAAPPTPKLAVGQSRKFTEAEIALAQSIFGTAIDTSKPEIFRKKFFQLQPKDVAMTPNGNMYFHPDGSLYRDDFAKDSEVEIRGLFVHELVHIWQRQQGINVTARGIFERKYEYLPLTPGKKFTDYNIEQQGDIVRDYYYLTQGFKTPGSATIEEYQTLIPFLPNK